MKVIFGCIVASRDIAVILCSNHGLAGAVTSHGSVCAPRTSKGLLYLRDALTRLADAEQMSSHSRNRLGAQASTQHFSRVTTNDQLFHAGTSAHVLISGRVCEVQANRASPRAKRPAFPVVHAAPLRSLSRYCDVRPRTTKCLVVAIEPERAGTWIFAEDAHA